MRGPLISRLRYTEQTERRFAAYYRISTLDSTLRSPKAGGGKADIGKPSNVHTHSPDPLARVRRPGSTSGPGTAAQQIDNVYYYPVRRSTSDTGFIELLPSASHVAERRNRSSWPLSDESGGWTRILLWLLESRLGAGSLKDAFRSISCDRQGPGTPYTIANSMN